MSWLLLLTRPILIAGQSAPLATQRDAISHLRRHFADARQTEALNDVMVALALAFISDRSVRNPRPADMLAAPRCAAGPACRMTIGGIR